MNINKLFEGQRHDDKEIMYILSKNGISRMFYPDLVEVNLMKQYAEHFLVKFLDIEIERLENEKKQDKCNKEEECPWCERNMYCRGREDAIGYNASIADQITYLQDIKRQLTESK